MKSLEELILLREEANRLYRSGLPSPLTDQEYDAIEAAIRAQNPLHPTLTKGRDDVGVAEYYSEKPLSMRMSSQQKALTWEDLQKFFQLGTNQTVYHVSFKVDGMTSELTYSNGKLVQVLTGGDGVTGRDITEQALLIPNLPKLIPIENGVVHVRGEIHMESQRFRDANNFLEKQGKDLLKAPRNAAVGIMRTKKNKDLAQFLSFRAFDMSHNPFPGISFAQADPSSLKEEPGSFNIIKQNANISIQHPPTLSDRFKEMQSLGFATPTSIAADAEGIKNFFDEIYAKRELLPYEIDGLVISFNNLWIVHSLGYNNEDCPKGQIALKFPAQASFVTIKDVEWSFEGGFFATPVGIYDPTLISGAVCSRVSLKSAQWMKENKIGVGSVVQVTRSGDVIPTINTDLKDWLIFTPDVWEPRMVPQCPHCSHEVIEDGARLRCKNEDCPAKEAARIDYFLKKMKVKGVASKMLKSWVDAGLTLRTFWNEDELLAAEGKLRSYKEESGDSNISLNIFSKIKSQLESAEKLSFADLMDALSIEGAGTLTWELFEKEGHNSPAKVLALSVESIAQIGKVSKKTIGKEIAERIYNSLRSREELFAYFNRYLQTEAQTGIDLKMPVSGLNICLTGTAPIPREELIKTLKLAGATIQSDVNSKTNLLFSDNPQSQTGKMLKAIQLRIPVHSYGDLLK